MQKEGQIKGESTPISQWRISYIKHIIDELHPTGDVLEVGWFEHGQASAYIQTFHPKSHTIIESDPNLVKEARNWAKSHPNVTIIEDKWQNALSKLKIFNAILFNNELLDNFQEVFKRQSREEAVISASKAKELLGVLQEELSHVEAVYTDHDIDKFYLKVGRANLNKLPNFFRNLKDKGHISHEQYERAMKKYCHEGESKTKEMATDPLLLCLEECLKHHMHKGSRFSCYLNDLSSRYEDTQFSDRIITNPSIDYREELVSIKVPGCQFSQALVLVVEKAK